MGSRGGPNPHAMHTVRSMVVEYAITELGDDESTWPEFAPVMIEVLAPERTLLEKCALLHNLGAKIAQDQDQVALEYIGRAGRHYYDVARLLSDEGVRDSLDALGPDGVEKFAANIDEASDNAGWRFEPRPEDRYGVSVAFDADAPCHANAAAAYESAMPTFDGEAPTFVDVLTTVRKYRHLI
ncbi:hypothetical protein FA014_03805 [Cellulomonas hominis]|uniref:DUF4375 domain-containing protein n=1 Tax=Cellulomonas hominis TaxID=156981 RepID=A0A7Z8K106_9CELL|nr:hypothetical protein FA014_03805 [Cellulomonas hominis]